MGVLWFGWLVALVRLGTFMLLSPVLVGLWVWLLWWLLLVCIWLVSFAFDVCLLRLWLAIDGGLLGFVSLVFGCVSMLFLWLVLFNSVAVYLV